MKTECIHDKNYNNNKTLMQQKNFENKLKWRI